MLDTLHDYWKIPSVLPKGYPANITATSQEGFFSLWSWGGGGVGPVASWNHSPLIFTSLNARLLSSLFPSSLLSPPYSLRSTFPSSPLSLSTLTDPYFILDYHIWLFLSLFIFPLHYLFLNILSLSFLFSFSVWRIFSPFFSPLFFSSVFFLHHSILSFFLSAVLL